MRHKCHELGIHNVSIQANLFNTLVASRLNYGCEVWGVYHMLKQTSDGGGWGNKGEAELLQRKFLRGAFSLPESTTTGAVMMKEARRVPIMHAWLKQAMRWWNKIVSRDARDWVKSSLKANIGDGHPSTQCWSGSFISILLALHPASAEGVRTLHTIDVSTVMNELDSRWRNLTLGNWANDPVNGHVALRDLPESESTGIKLMTYNLWFAALDDNDTGGFIR